MKTDYPAVARITQLVGGMPLGLELAASWVNVLATDEIVAEIEQSLDFLESSLQDVPPRQRSIRAVFDYSWKLMSSREQQIFPKLSVFRGGFSRDAAKKVLGISARDLMGLVNKSLLQRSRDGRFDLHPLLRQYAIDILDDLEVCNSVHDAHCAYFVSALQDLGESLTDRRQQQALSVLDADIDNAWAAWEWAIDRRQVERIDQAIYGLLNFLYRQFRFEEGLEAIRSAEHTLAAPANGIEQRVYGHILAWRAMFEMRLGNMEKAQPFFHQSWDQIEKAAATGEDTRYEQAFLYSMKAIMSIESGNLDTAKDLLEHSLALYKEIDHKYGASETLFEMAWLSSQQGETEAVNQYYIKSLELKRQIGDHYGLANELYVMAVQEAFQLGNIEKAKDLFWESSDLFQDLGDTISNARAIRIMDDLYIISGWFEVALVTRQKMMKLYQNLGDIAGIGWQHAQLGEAYYHLGDYENAERDGRRALAVLKDKVYPTEQAYARWQLGMTLLARGQEEEAHRFFQECVQVYAGSNRKDGMGSAHAGLARADFAQKAYDQAWEHALTSVQYLTEFPHIFWMFYALATVALLLAHEGQAERAIEVYNLISRYDFVANSQWFKDVFGRYLESTAAKLDSQKVQAARERSKSLDVWETAQELIYTFQDR
jgi:tetratricopeptide (TPR) repeat protein